MEPDVVVSTAAAVESQAAAWAADWAGTVPSGKTTDDDRVIGVDTTIGALVLDESFPQHVWIRPSGATFTDYDCSVKFGSIELNGSTNIGLFLVHSIGSQALRVAGSTNLIARRCFFQGNDVASPTTTNFDSPDHVVNCVGGTTTNAVFEDCCIGWSQNGIYSQASITGFELHRVVFDWLAHDNWKNSSILNDMSVIDCWFARNYRSAQAAPDDHHEDAFQNQGGGDIDGGTLRGNFMAKMESRWLNQSSGSYQGFWFGNSQPAENLACSQNLMASNNGVFKWSGSSAGCTVSYNTLVHVTNQDTACNADGGTRSFNWTMTKSPGSTDSGAGTNGVAIDVQSYISKDLTDSDPYWANGTPTTESYIMDFLPAQNPGTGSTMHWNGTGTKVGAWERFQEIFEQKLVPGNVGWPVAAPWHEQYDPLNELGTSYVADTYDSEGDNIVAGLTYAKPVIKSSGLVLANGLPLMGGT